MGEKGKVSSFLNFFKLEMMISMTFTMIHMKVMSMIKNFVKRKSV